MSLLGRDPQSQRSHRNPLVEGRLTQPSLATPPLVFSRLLGSLNHGLSESSTVIRYPQEEVVKRCATLVAVGCALAVLSGVAAQTPANAPPQPPTFRAAVQLIEIDVAVTDQQGRFVNDLTKGDFEVFEDGMRQPVASLTLFNLPIEALPAPGPGVEPLEPDVVSNLVEGRIYVMLLDCCAPTLSSQTAQLWGRRFVDEAIRPNDLMAVVHVQGSISDGQGFTSSKRLMRQAIDRYLRAPGVETGGDNCARLLKLRTTYEAIEDVALRLGNVTGRRKAILWVNGDIPYDPNVTFGSSSGPDQPPCSGAAVASSVSFMHRDAIRAATRHNVAIYPIDPAGLSTSTGSAELQRTAALRNVADDTGGEAMVGTNNFRPIFERIVRQNSTYYLLAYYPTTEHRDGKFHNVTVRLKRRGLTVRAKKGYFAATSAPKPPAEVLPASGLSAAGRSALRSPTPVRGLGVELFAAPFKGTGRAASVVLGAQISGGELRLADGNRIEISYIPVNQQGQIGRGAWKVFTLNFTGASRTLIGQSGVRFVDRIDLLPGRHELRFSVNQPGGATGSVVTQIEVPDFSANPLTMSGLLLAASSTDRHRTLLSDAALKSDLLGDPTAVRRFTNAETVGVFGELYANAALSDSVIDVTASIVSAAGGEMQVVQRPEVTNAAGGRRKFIAHLPLTTLPPGPYRLVVRASSRTGNASAGRQVSFTIVQ